jgi:penicillin-binding protein 2
LPSSEWSKRVRKTQWYAGETISVAIGQGAVNTTPMQMLRAISAIATGGRLTTPHVLHDTETGAGQIIEWPVTQLPFKDEHTRRIREGMWQSVNGGGTGRNAMIPGLDICGKTGTVQVVGRENLQRVKSNTENHSWFAGFAGRDNPEIAVVVFAEHAGSGGAVAAPIAREIFRAYYEKDYTPPNSPESESGEVEPENGGDAPAGGMP